MTAILKLVGNTPPECRGIDAACWYHGGMSTCVNCRTDVDHCHGTLVAHGDGTLDCTDAACAATDPMRHALIIDCAAVMGGCCDQPATPEDLARAS